MKPQPLVKTPTSNPVMILRATSDTSRNLVIRSAAYDVINQSTIIHVQKIKDMMLEINSAKKLKIPNEVSKATRMNPDSSCVIYITAEICQSARIVAINKDNHRKGKEVKKAETSLKKAISDKEKTDAIE